MILKNLHPPQTYSVWYVAMLQQLWDCCFIIIRDSSDCYTPLFWFNDNIGQQQIRITGNTTALWSCCINFRFFTKNEIIFIFTWFNSAQQNLLKSVNNWNILFYKVLQLLLRTLPVLKIVAKRAVYQSRFFKYNTITVQYL